MKPAAYQVGDRLRWRTDPAGGEVITIEETHPPRRGKELPGFNMYTAGSGQRRYLWPEDAKKWEKVN